MIENPEIDDNQLFLYFELNFRTDLEAELQKYMDVSREIKERNQKNN